MSTAATPTVAARHGTAAHRVLLVLAVILIGANMRPAITDVGPLLTRIGEDTGLSTTVLGLLGSVPPVTWAIVSPFTQAISRRFGIGRTMMGALVLLGVGTLVRSLLGAEVGLWAGMVIIGAAIAVVNVLMPSVVKRDFPDRVRLMTGVYSSLIGGMGAVSSTIAVPIADAPAGEGTIGWVWSLLITGATLLPFAIVLWGVHMRIAPKEPPVSAEDHVAAGRAIRAIWGDGVAWLIALFMGLQATIYMVTITWLSPLAQSYGSSQVAAGIDVGLFQLFSVGGSLLLPLLLRVRWRRWVPAVIPTGGLIAVLGLMLFPTAIPFWTALAGIFSGSWLAMSLTLMAERARDHATAGALSGMAQSVGYGIVAIGPFAFGALHSLTGAWVAPLGYLLLMVLGLFIVGWLTGRFERRVLEPPAQA